MVEAVDDSATAPDLAAFIASNSALVGKRRGPVFSGVFADG